MTLVIEVAETPVVDVPQRINHILRACGLLSEHVSSQLHVKPEMVHLIAPSELQFLARHAALLTTHKDVICDFNALFCILWALLRDTEALADQVEMQCVAEEAGQPIDSTTLEDGASSGASTTPQGSLGRPSLRHLSKLLIPSLTQSIHAAIILCAFADASLGNRKELDGRCRFKPVQADVEMSIRLIGKIACVLRREAGSRSSMLCVTGKYLAAGHHLFQVTEHSMTALLKLAAALAAFPATDMRSTVSLFNSDLLWKSSGMGAHSTQGYADSVRCVVHALHAKRASFDNVDEMVAQLVVNRLARRPPYQWELFKLLYFDDEQLRYVNSCQGGSGFGQLVIMCCVQDVVERCLLPHRSQSSTEVAGVKAFRKAVEPHIRRLEERNDGTLLSYFQLFVYAAIFGMPALDLTNDHDLVKRATVTHLTHNSELIDPSFLRLLAAFPYTVGTDHSDVLEHGRLSAESALLIYDAIEQHIFQTMRFGQPPSTTLNPLYAVESLKVKTLIQTILQHTVSMDTMGGAVVSPVEEDSVEKEVRLPSSRQEVPMRDAAGTLLGKINTTIRAIYQAHEEDVEELRHLRVKQYDRLDAAPTSLSQSYRAVTLHVIDCLFPCFNSARFIAYIDLLKALQGLARLFALRVYYPVLSTETVPKQQASRRLIVRMEKALTALPQKMRAAEVNSVLTSLILPNTYVGQSEGGNRLFYGLLEGYLRAMATASAAYAVTDELLLKHWVDVALHCVTNRVSPALAAAAHDFLIAPFLARKPLSPFFVPTYVAVFVPTSKLPKYGEPSLLLVMRFAKMVRACCQGIEMCDGTALERAITGEDSHVAALVPASAKALTKLTPYSAVLLVVSSIFDKLCSLWTATPGYVRDARQRFTTYFSALANLLQCTTNDVLHRVCASIEAIELEHLRGTGPVQMQFLKHIGHVVDSVQGSTKKEIAEWFLKLTAKVSDENVRISKL